MTSWRNSIKVHPAADLFYPLELDAFAELIDDIRSNGILVPIVTWREEDGQIWLLDGRNRLDALEHLSRPCIDEAGRLCAAPDARSWETDPDPTALVVGFNSAIGHWIELALQAPGDVK